MTFKEVYKGDHVNINVPYGNYRGTVHRFDKLNKNEYSIKLIGIERLDQPGELSIHRFWHYEISHLEVIKRQHTPEKVKNQQWTIDNDEETVPYHNTKMEHKYQNVDFVLIENRDKLASILPTLMKMKEIGVLLEPPYPETARYINLSNGKQNFLINLEFLPTAMMHLSKLLQSEDRLKVTANSHEMNLLLGQKFGAKMTKVIDIEMFGRALESESSPYFKGYVSLVKKCLNTQIPPPLSTIDVTKINDQDTLNKMALRVQYLRPLKKYLMDKMMEKTFEATNILMKSLVNKDEKTQNVTRKAMSKFKLPVELERHFN